MRFDSCCVETEKQERNIKLKYQWKVTVDFKLSNQLSQYQTNLLCYYAMFGRSGEMEFSQERKKIISIYFHEDGQIRPGRRLAALMNNKM
jgi:hypothetical protein